MDEEYGTGSEEGERRPDESGEEYDDDAGGEGEYDDRDDEYEGEGGDDYEEGEEEDGYEDEDPGNLTQRSKKSIASKASTQRSHKSDGYDPMSQLLGNYEDLPRAGEDAQKTNRTNRSTKSEMHSHPLAMDLMDVAGNGELDAVKRLVEEEKVPVNVTEEDSGSTPLHRAAFNGHVEISSYLISRGAKINFQNFSGKTPLHGSASAGHENVSDMLVKAGADVNLVNNDGDTALHIAACFGRAGIVKVLRVVGADTEVVNEMGQVADELASDEATRLAFETPINAVKLKCVTAKSHPRIHFDLDLNDNEERDIAMKLVQRARQNDGENWEEVLLDDVPQEDGPLDDDMLDAGMLSFDYVVESPVDPYGVHGAGGEDGEAGGGDGPDSKYSEEEKEMFEAARKKKRQAEFQRFRAEEELRKLETEKQQAETLIGKYNEQLTVCADEIMNLKIRLGQLSSEVNRSAEMEKLRASVEIEKLRWNMDWRTRSFDDDMSRLKMRLGEAEKDRKDAEEQAKKAMQNLQRKDKEWGRIQKHIPDFLRDTLGIPDEEFGEVYQKLFPKEAGKGRGGPRQRSPTKQPNAGAASGSPRKQSPSKVAQNLPNLGRKGRS